MDYYDWYEEDIPHHGQRFQEGGKVFYWNMANHGDTVEYVMSNYNCNGKRPVDAMEIKNAKGESAVIVKWEA